MRIFRPGSDVDAGKHFLSQRFIIKGLMDLFTSGITAAFFAITLGLVRFAHALGGAR